MNSTAIPPFSRIIRIALRVALRAALIERSVIPLGEPYVFLVARGEVRVRDERLAERDQIGFAGGNAPSAFPFIA